jgi:zinc/manganese transport system substrate-binding protein
MTACSGGDDSAAPSAQPGGDCPTEPVSVVVSVDQWGGIVSQLGGPCAEVSTVVASSSVDPHDFEPAPKDAALFEGAQLIVVNGGHYDEWASKLAAGSAPDAPVIDALQVSGSDDHGHAGDAHAHEGHDHAHEGHDHAGEANPHVWYNPAAVTAVADAVTAELGELAPDAADYFAERHAEFGDALAPYHQVIGSIKATATGKTYAATESVFDDMAAAVGLVNRTPEGYQAAAANESEPSPAALDAFLSLLADRGVDVLIYNTQTEGSVPQQIRAAAEQAGVPVVEVTESVPPGASSFQSWQVDQLSALAEALGVGG